MTFGKRCKGGCVGKGNNWKFQNCGHTTPSLQTSSPSSVFWLPTAMPFFFNVGTRTFITHTLQELPEVPCNRVARGDLVVVAARQHFPSLLHFFVLTFLAVATCLSEWRVPSLNRRLPYWGNITFPSKIRKGKNRRTECGLVHFCSKLSGEKTDALWENNMHKKQRMKLTTMLDRQGRRKGKS